MAEHRRSRFRRLFRRNEDHEREKRQNNDDRESSSSVINEAQRFPSGQYRLWDNTLEALRHSNEDLELVTIIEEFAVNPAGDNVSAQGSQEAVKRLVNDIMEEMQKNAKSGSSDDNISRLVEKTISILNRFVSVLDVAVSFDPVHAALPWAAIRFALVTLTTNNELKNRLIESITNVASLIVQCDTYQNLYLNSGSSPELPDTTTNILKNAIVQVYTSCLLLLGFAIQRQRSRSRRVNAVFKLEDLRDYTNKIEMSESRLHKVANDCEKHVNHHQSTTMNKIHLEMILDKLPIVEVAQLAKVNEWVADPNSQCILWLQGMAGTGKSTISRTIAHELAKKKALGASFFFKRGRGDRDKAIRFFTTIAAQLASNIPSLTPHMKNAVEDNPKIREKGITIQFKELIIEPLSKLDSNERNLQTIAVIIVDALDECDPETDVTAIISLLPQVKQFKSVRLKFFITSRPEFSILFQFDKINGTYRDLILHRVDQLTIANDIKIFFELELSKIKGEYNGLHPDWPGNANIQILVQRAVPLFIFAKTMCLFIQDRACGSPEDQLNKILEYKIWLLIFNFIQHIFRFLTKCLKSVSLAQLLGIPQTTIKHRLSMLHSVLNIPPKENPQQPVKVLHLSFRDFLTNPKMRTENPFWVNQEEAHKRIAAQCFELLMDKAPLHKDMCGLQFPGTLRADVNEQKIANSLPPEIQYACLYWVYHLKESKCMVDDKDRVLQFLKDHFLHWLEVLSLLGRIREGINMVNELVGIIELERGVETMEFLRDARRFILNWQSVVDLAPLQLYSSALFFTPEGSIVRWTSERFMSRWIIQRPEMRYDWDTLLMLESRENMYKIAFSVDSRFLASASMGGLITIWDMVTGQEVQKLEVPVDI
ncbi:hypothetical protein F5884DRAFT_855722 [Xylogone sp. PMI_703]|nr:hypothetical protein F5884DRAFT_855722 [Xylogone sp. PMI_703]